MKRTKYTVVINAQKINVSLNEVEEMVVLAFEHQEYLTRQELLKEVSDFLENNALTNQKKKKSPQEVLIKTLNSLMSMSKNILNSEMKYGVRKWFLRPRGLEVYTKVFENYCKI